MASTSNHSVYFISISNSTGPMNIHCQRDFINGLRLLEPSVLTHLQIKKRNKWTDFFPVVLTWYDYNRNNNDDNQNANRIMASFQMKRWDMLWQTARHQHKARARLECKECWTRMCLADEGRACSRLSIKTQLMHHINIVITMLECCDIVLCANVR